MKPEGLSLWILNASWECNESIGTTFVRKTALADTSCILSVEKGAFERNVVGTRAEH